jgi:hypothetical protein
MLSGRGLCDGPIAYPEESYRVSVCVSLSLISATITSTPKMGRHKEFKTEKERNKQTNNAYNMLKNLQNNILVYIYVKQDHLTNTFVNYLQLFNPLVPASMHLTNN